MTNITIQWDRVDCQERNGFTDSYRVVYYPTSDPSDRKARVLTGTGDSDRMFTATGLHPRTSYTFEVQASNTNLDVRGAPATFTVSTSTPQSESLTISVYNYSVFLKNILFHYPCRLWFSPRWSALS